MPEASLESDPSRAQAASTTTAAGETDPGTIIHRGALARRPVEEIAQQLLAQGYLPDGMDEHIRYYAAEWVNLAIKELEKSRAINAVFFLAGGAITAYTYIEALSGGTYVVAWGAILFGGLRAATQQLEISRYQAYLRKLSG